MKPHFTLYSSVLLLGAFQGIFLTLAILNSKKQNLGTFFLALCTLVLALDLVHEFLIQSEYIFSVPLLAFIDPLVNLLYGPTIYLYVTYMTARPESKYSAFTLLHFLPTVVAILFLFVLPETNRSIIESIFYNLDSTDTNIEPHLGFVRYVALTGVMSLSLYLTFSIVRLLKHTKAVQQEFSNLENITLNWLRNLLCLYICSYLLLIIGSISFKNTDIGENLNNILYLLMVLTLYSIAYMGLKQPTIFDANKKLGGERLESISEGDSITIGNTELKVKTDNKTYEKYKTSALNKELSEALSVELIQNMESHQPYLDSKLTLSQLSEQLNISSNYLSQIINENMNMHFFDFINSYRIKYAREKMLDNKFKHLNIIDIVFESGFNSKSSFYTAFKKHVGQTPNQFKQSLKSTEL